MKKIVSMVLMIMTLLFTFSSINVFAAEEKYPPVESGVYKDYEILSEYQYNVMGHGSEIFDFDEILSVRIKPIVLSISESEENEIINDYRTLYNGYELGEVSVECYGVLSDGSKLLYISAENLAFLTDFYYVVIGKYLTTNSDSHYVIYKEHNFTGFDGLSDELLDETAEILQFAKFVNPNEQSDIEPTTVTSATNPVSTPDTPAQNNSDNKANPNNSNGSIPTGQNTDIALLSVLIISSSVIIFFIAKNKNKSLY